MSRPDGPVFVDPSGRRSTVVRSVGWVVAAVVVGYLLLVAVALVGPPGLSRVTVPGLGPVLPGPGAAGIDGGQTSREAPGAVLERSPSPSRSAAPPSAAARPTASVARSTAPSPRVTPSVAAPSPTPTTTPTPTPTATPRRTGPPTAQPSREAPPGASRRPTRSPG